MKTKWVAVSHSRDLFGPEIEYESFQRFHSEENINEVVARGIQDQERFRDTPVRVGAGNAVVDRLKRILQEAGESCWNQRQMLGLVLKCSLHRLTGKAECGCRYRQVGFDEE